MNTTCFAEFTIIFIILSILSCKKDSYTSIELYDNVNTDDTIDINVNTQPNILLIIADDMGRDATNGYPEGELKPVTPNIDDIKNNGITFNNFWANPTCAPTRASMITGKYGYRTNVKWATDILSDNENILQKYISDETNSAYANAVIGKWHLNGNDLTFNPEDLGIDYYAGIMGGTIDDYYNWTLSEDGAYSTETSYVTEKLTNIAIDWVQNQQKPWFLWLAYNAPHTPFHAPPVEMHSQGSLPEYTESSDPLPYFLAAIEAMDYQIGRFMDSLDNETKKNTIIIFLGDNGSPNQVAQHPYTSSAVKGTLYQGGINTPLFISGKGVTRTGYDNNLIGCTDMFATIANIAGVEINEIYDSKSFAHLFTTDSSYREFTYTELKKNDNNQWTIRNEAYKLITGDKGKKVLYDLHNDPYEIVNLNNDNISTDQQTSLSLLEEELQRIRN